MSALATTRLLYDAAATRFPTWPAAAAGLVAGALGALLLHRWGRARAVQWIGTTLAILGPAWTVIMGAGLYNEHARLRNALASGDYTLVDGIVHDRPPITSGDPAWLVESGPTAHWYRYGVSPLATGYHRTGPGTQGLHDGTHVRLADVDGRIARLEIVR